MQTILHIPESAVQEVMQHLCQIHDLSQPLLYSKVKAVLKKYYPNVDELVVKDIISAVSESNVMASLCGKHGTLGTVKRRTAYVRTNFPLVMPIQYVVDKGTKTAVYVPIQHMLQKLLNKTDILEKAMSEKVHVPHEYSSYADGEHFKENCLLSVDEFTVALILYLDDFEVAKPLGTSKLKHKMCALYWVIANIPAKYRSTLKSIQLALLCNTSTIKQCGYERVLQPLIHDLVSLEEHGVYVEQLGASVKGTVLFVVADNLAAHSLAGFHESFTVNKFCRVYMASRSDIQHQEVSSGFFYLRDKMCHDMHVQEVMKDSRSSQTSGVKGRCPLTTSLKHFHAVKGYPPDILHNVLEGIVPVEVSLCLTDLISKNYFTLDMLNDAIRSFSYTFTDKTNQPQKTGKGFSPKGTIGGNGHENWSVIRLIPLYIGHCVPEGDHSWEIMMLLKDIVELVVAPKHTDDTLHFLECKLAEHRELLQSSFPDFRLRPKHHYVEHYPHLIKKFGPLTDVWTMRFEGKHKFFKKVVRESQNFKNVAMTLATKHQKALSYFLDCSSFFRPAAGMTKVAMVSVTSFPSDVQRVLPQNVTAPGSVLVASSVCIDGIKYNTDMMLCIGSCSGLPEFGQITQIVAANPDILFVCKRMTAWYHKHFRSYQLCYTDGPCMCVVKLSDLYDVFPLSAYNVQGKLMVTLKRFVIC